MQKQSLQFEQSIPDTKLFLKFEIFFNETNIINIDLLSKELSNLKNLKNPLAIPLFTDTIHKAGFESKLYIIGKWWDARRYIGNIALWTMHKLYTRLGREEYIRRFKIQV